eukprot:14250-Heterococcus_DN1.PRE.1
MSKRTVGFNNIASSTSRAVANRILGPYSTQAIAFACAIRVRPRLVQQKRASWCSVLALHNTDEQCNKSRYALCIQRRAGSGSCQRTTAAEELSAVTVGAEGGAWYCEASAYKH